MAKERMTFTVDESIAAAARQKSDETGLPLSVVVERSLAEWAKTGILPAKEASKAKKKK